MKIVFLDIDGVLNRTNFSEELYADAFTKQDVPLCMDLVDNLKTLVESDPDIRVVWTTDWRLTDTEKWNEWINPRLWLERQDWMKDRVIGITPKKMSSSHYHEIKWWLDDHKDIKKYVILEDSYFPEDWFGLEKHVVRIDSAIGFDKNNLTKAFFIIDLPRKGNRLQ